MKLPATHQKLRGGYYTPQPIGDFLAKWAVQSSTAAVLEPSCGDGVLLEAAAKRLLELGAPPHQVGYSLHAVEFIAEEARIASEKLKILDISLAEGHLHVGDFFARCKDLLSQDQKFDVIIGNPPFI
ncbi:MAG: N-6 DNA methylase, partial [Anaerolineae bacterium]|nr:N-6 DNA methylase [Anaerolineae bacterium]